MQIWRRLLWTLCPRAQMLERSLPPPPSTAFATSGSGPTAYCIRPRAASMISIFADLPRTSSATTVTPIGEVIRRPIVVADFLDIGVRVPRDRDRSIRANGDQIEQRRDAAALDEVLMSLAKRF